MDIYDKLIQVISNYDNFDNRKYKSLSLVYEKENVDIAISEILSNKEKYLQGYNVLLNADLLFLRSHNILYFKRLKEIINRLNDLFVELNVYKSGRIIADMVDSANAVADDDRLATIKNLYSEFLIIRNKLFEAHIGYVESIMKKYENDMEYESLYQEASMGLLLAIEKYDIDLSNFGMFAYRYINFRVYEHRHDLDLCISFPDKKRKEYYRFLKIYEQFKSTYGREPLLEEIADQIDMPVETLHVYMMLLGYTQSKISLYDYDENGNRYIDGISNDVGIRTIEDLAMHDNLRETLLELVERLPEQERDIIKKIYFLDKPLTYRQIAKEVNKSVGGVGVVHKRALSILGRHKYNLEKYLSK